MFIFRTLAYWLMFSMTVSYAAEVTSPERAFSILRDNCHQCHSQTVTMGGLNLTSREAALKVIVPGDTEKSKLMHAVQRKGPIVMPPTKALPAADVDALRAWINDGAKWPTTVAKTEVASNWWSFQKIRKPTPPTGASHPIDAFIVAKLKQNGMQQAPEADRRTLLRRVYFDLTGLPPTYAEIKAFVEDQSPDAYTKVVDALLASPRYGEKWGRHWLDLTRYSDTAGFELDSYIADAWRYRDYVIDSFNKDTPYDRFIREQIAADELFPEDPVARTGTGLYCVGPNRDLYPDQSDINREETLTDYVDTTSAVFLGMTAGCARCHDHKFDPIPQKDYYRIQAIFAPAVKVKVALNRLMSLGYDVAANSREIKLREIGEQIRAIREDCRTKVKKDEVEACMDASKPLDAIGKKLIAMYSDYRPKPFACGLEDIGNVSPHTFIPAKGLKPKELVEPGFFTVLGGGVVPPPADKRETTGPIPLGLTTGRRTALANWISDPQNPLTARVMVNRIWQYHFGRGLVATSSDFGTRGHLPSHPELLDWLASEFKERGWSIKQMHRLMVTSATYRQSAAATEIAAQKDPQNLLLSHFTRRRLQSDEVRDAVLQVTGALNLKAGGPPVVPPLSKEELYGLIGRPDNAWIVTADATEHVRRSIYMIQKRTFRLPLMEVFDTPESMLTCPKRESSTTAPQSLSLLNGSFTMQRASEFASKLATDNPSSEALIAAAWRGVLGRDPDESERQMASEFLAKQGDKGSTELLRGLLNVNEFLYVD